MKKVYELTPGHRAQLAPWHERWLQIALNTDPMTDDDREKCRVAVEGMYRAAKLTPPPRERIVFVASPLVAMLAGGAASAIWYMRGNPEFAAQIADVAADANLSDATSAATSGATWAATWNATRAATSDATRAAMSDATWNATRAATSDATWAATRAATWVATWDATSDATRDATLAATLAATWAAMSDATLAATWAAMSDATWNATRAATWDATRDATLDGARLSLSRWFLQCAHELQGRMYADGGEWTGYVEFMSFFKDVVRLDLKQYADYIHYEAATLYGGARVMHTEFCLVADRPEFFRMETVNGRGRLHCVDGPAKGYRDGWSIYALHGIQIPDGAAIIDGDRPGLTVERVTSEANAEVRRVLVELYGRNRYLRDAGARRIDVEHPPAGDLWAAPTDVAYRALWRLEQANDEPIVVVDVVNQSPEPVGWPADGEAYLEIGSRTYKRYMLRVPPTMTTCADAIAWTCGKTASTYAPLVES